MTAVATVEPQKAHPVVELFTSERAREYIEAYLPEGTDIKRVAATVLLAIQSDKTKKLGTCTPKSLIMGVARIQQWGLELGVTAHLLPFKDKDSGDVEATPVADYKGLIELMVRSGAVRAIDVRVVYEGDEFTYKLGLMPQIDHWPAARREKNAKITFAYCILRMPFGQVAFDVMSADEIDAIRQQYSKQWKSGPLPAWYAKKTVVRQVAKLVPKNPRMANTKLAEAMEVLEQERADEMEIRAPGTVQSLRAGDDEDAITVPDEREPGDDRDEPNPFD